MKLRNLAILMLFGSALLSRGAETAKPGPVITLEQAYDKALASDQSIRIAYYEVRKAKLLPWSAVLSRLGPSLNGDAAFDANWTTTHFHDSSSSSQSSSTTTGLMGSGSSFSSARTVSTPSRQRVQTTTGALSLSFEQPIFDASVIPAFRLARLSETVSRLQRTATVRDTLFGVAQAYFNVLKFQSIVAVNRESVDLAAGQLDIAQKRFDVGDVARTDVSRAKATLENARRALIESEATLATARNDLGNILNLGGDTGFSVAEPAPLPPTDETFDPLLQRAYRLREDYRIAQLAVDQDIARRNIVATEYVPKVVAQADQNWSATASDPRSSTSGRESSAVALSVQVPFLNGGQREIDLRTANHQVQETKLRLEQTGKSVQQQVKNAWLQVRSLREAIKASAAEAQASELNYKDLRAQYEAGAAISLDVQAALRELNNAQATLAGNRYDYEVALRDLQRAQAIFEHERVERSKMK